MTLTLLLLEAILLAPPQAPPAPPPTGIVALLWHDSPNDQKALVGLKRGLVALDLSSELRVVDVDRDEAKAVAVLKDADANARCVVAFGTRAALLARANTKRVPVVFTAVTNPVLSGVVDSWEASGTNLCGNSNWLDRREMLDAFRLAVPGLKRLCVLTSEGNKVSAAEVAEARSTLAEMPGLELRQRIVEDVGKLDEVLARAVTDIDALWVPIDFQLYQEDPLRRIIRAAADARIPVVSSTERCAGRGALVVVTVDYEALGLKAASILKRVLKRGETPGRIPVGRMKAARIYVDLAASERLGKEMPLDLVLKAWRVFGTEK